MTDYTPIDCGVHSEYELAILQRRMLRLTWRDAAGTVHIGVYRPLDLRTRDGEEFMVIRDGEDGELLVRLDYITAFEPA